MRNVVHKLTLFHPTYHGSGVVKLQRYLINMTIANVEFRKHYDDDVRGSPMGVAVHTAGNVKTL
jgi:hypothetical protein